MVAKASVPGGKSQTWPRAAHGRFGLGLTMREVMKKVKDMGKTEKEVMTCAEVMTEMAMSDDGFEDEDTWEELKGVEKMSRELYMWLRLRTEGEAKLIVGSLEDEDGIMAWGVACQV